MTPDQFNLAISRTRMRGRAIGPARRVLCDGLGITEAGAEVGINRETVRQAIARINSAHKNIIGCPRDWECVTICVPREDAHDVREFETRARKKAGLSTDF
jgi:TrfB plasmid transcriptional repressor